MGAVRTRALADLRHRRLQALVIGTVLLLATGAATLALNILVESQAPFDHAFAAANGADLVLEFDGRTGAADLTATTHAAGVTGSAGPWPVAQVAFEVSPQGAPVGVKLIRGGEVAGRPDPNTVVDRITVSAGRWWSAPGEMVLSQTAATAWGKNVGDTIVVDQPPAVNGPSGLPAAGAARPGTSGETLTVVGIAASISTPNLDGWMSPADIAAVTPGKVLDQQILYTVTPAATTADLSSAIAAISHGLPAGAVVNSQTYLVLAADVNQLANTFVPLLLAFSVFALAAAAFIIANVVSGIVLTSYREIGVLKAIGYTPAQVIAVLLAEIMIPVVAGAVAGTTLGTFASQPILSGAARSFGLPSAFTLSAPIVVAVLAAAAAASLLAALVPAIRAGRLSAVGAIARGSTPPVGRAGGFFRTRAARLPLPVPVRLGLSAGFAHPVRAAMTLGALLVGVAALVFAVGLDTSLTVIAQDFVRDQASPIRVSAHIQVGNGDPVTAAIAADNDTARFVSIGRASVGVAELGTSIPFVAYRSDSSWLGYALISGRWFAAPGEAVAPTNFFTQTGLHVGDEVTVAFDGHQLTVTLVGQVFDLAGEGSDDLVLRGEWADLASLDPGLQPTRWEVEPRAGVNVKVYQSALQQQVGGGVSVDAQGNSSANGQFLLFETVITGLGIVLVVVSLGGVFNTVMLETRQRIRETAVLKAIGMTPRQVVAMVVVSVIPIGILAGLIGAPLGIGLSHVVLGYMGQAADKTAIPTSASDVIPPLAVVALGFGGLAIAALGAYLPAQAAARARIAEILQAE